MDWRQRYLIIFTAIFMILSFQVVVVAGDLVLQKELWNRAQKQVVVVTSNELSEVVKRK